MCTDLFANFLMCGSPLEKKSTFCPSLSLAYFLPIPVSSLLSVHPFLHPNFCSFLCPTYFLSIPVSSLHSVHSCF